MKPISSLNIFLWLIVLNLPSVYAQSSSRFTITRNAIAVGGATLSSSGRFQLASLAGQPVASAPESARFSIQGGFWIWPAPVIFAPTKVGNNFTISFQTEPGKLYTVNYSDSLATPSWQYLSNVDGDGTVKTVSNSAPGVTQRYYRLLEQ
jgi:hypothetical protein